MEIRIVILGSSGSTPTKERGLPSVALIYKGDIFLFDCGEGTQMQMLKYGINSFKVKAIFLSHAHGDHIIGIAGLVRSLALNGRKEPLDIYIPSGYENVVGSLLSFDKAILGYSISIHGVVSGTFYPAKEFNVSAFPLRHGVATVGYIFKEYDKRRFIKDKCSRLGIKGTMFSELEKRGRIKVGNKTVNIENVTRLQTGKKIVYATDTRPLVTTARYSEGAELLIHECSYEDSEKGLAAERMHSSAADVAKIAKMARVKQLIITHISARYKSDAQIGRQARRVFRNTVVAKDGYSIRV